MVVVSAEQREEKFEVTDQQQHSKSEVADKCQHLKTEVAEETQEELQSKQSQLVLPKISESTTTHVADSTTERYQGNYLCKTSLSVSIIMIYHKIVSHLSINYHHIRILNFILL